MRKKVLLFVLLGAIAFVIAVIAFVWNRAPETVDDKKAIQVSAESITVAYGGNEQQANAEYLNKVIEVNGKISELSKNQDGKDVVLLESSDPLSGVQCTMRENGGKYIVGNAISIKGFCNGYTTVVLLSDCIVAR